MESTNHKNSYELQNIPNGRRGLFVEEVAPESIGEELGFEPGDQIVSINGQPVSDELDWIYLSASDEMLIEVQKQNGEIWEIDPELDEDEELGLRFYQTLASKTCSNRCLFCFIDQNPDGMRDTLYVKDDDERLSFLNGNYITLTNLREKEIERIERWKIPVNVSIHATDPEVRERLLGNRHAGKILAQLKRLKAANVEMNGQIVCVPGINDGEVLTKTLEDLKELYPQLVSVSVVPVGLTCHRKGLADIHTFDKDSARETLERIKAVQDDMLDEFGTRFVFASDEFYLLAQEELPQAAFYEGFPQLENGVGMIADFLNDAAMEEDRLEDVKAFPKARLFPTGKLAYPTLKQTVDTISENREGTAPRVLELTNHFYGPKVTVSGLFTGEDLYNQIKAELEDYPADEVILPESMIRNGTETFLDDWTVTGLSEKLGVPVRVVPTDGASFVRAALLDAFE